MTDVSGVGSGQDVLQQYSTDNNQEEEKSNELGQNQFMELLVAQLNNQNPLEPQDNTEFVAQLAQFSTVESLENLNTTAYDMQADMRSNQALQASSMVGRSVVVPGHEYSFLQSGDLIAGQTEIPATTQNLVLQIQNPAGQALETIDLGAHSRGQAIFRWDGANLEMDGEMVDLDRSLLNRQEYLKDEEGNVITDTEGNPIPSPYPPGDYKFVVSASIGGVNEGLETAMSGRVDSVTIGENSSVTLNISGGTQASINDVKQILQ